MEDIPPEKVIFIFKVSFQVTPVFSKKIPSLLFIKSKQCELALILLFRNKNQINFT